MLKSFAPVRSKRPAKLSSPLTLALGLIMVIEFVIIYGITLTLSSLSILFNPHSSRYAP